MTKEHRKVTIVRFTQHSVAVEGEGNGRGPVAFGSFSSKPEGSRISESGDCILNEICAMQSIWLHNAFFLTSIVASLHRISTALPGKTAPTFLVDHDQVTVK